ncbi:MAG: hypothetical protein Q8O42_11485 [Acidobacteriota bacterium]|nr:hypothetical protein [Acidobacteriota bacterium]
MNRTIGMGLAAAVIVALTAAACGGGSGGGSTPTTPTPTPPSTGSSTATITIGANGSVSPSSVTIARGDRVTFVNNHNRPHDMSSDPHPEHSQCPEINNAGFLSPGESRTTGNLNTARTCGFHDHIDFDNAGLKGTIIIQ